MDDLLRLGISPSYCHVMTNRKTHLPMPLFLVSLPSNEDNRNIYNISDVCSVKVTVEILNKKPGPAQCYRCQGFFHNSRYCTRNPRCLKCGKPHLTRDLRRLYQKIRHAVTAKANTLQISWAARTIL
ncbi:nucleic-acid-binding protein from transposon X-element [Trichonephila clavata]|uniref:Nucleic-acid-binding protein from transposon X-element n=1 Tax=Trichonephila clavata TaxID=2740835 RepID=A0A8X6F667_TRICU|nr:nucleic-acid-binding protein from transposon X-element [Trichonephila clavata]